MQYATLSNDQASKKEATKMLKKRAILIVVLGIVLAFALIGLSQANVPTTQPNPDGSTAYSPEGGEPEPEGGIPIICWQCFLNCFPISDWEYVYTYYTSCGSSTCQFLGSSWPAMYKVDVYHQEIACQDCTCCLWIPVSCAGYVTRDAYKRQYTQICPCYI